MLLLQHSVIKQCKKQNKTINLEERRDYDCYVSDNTLTTLAAQARGRKRCGTAAVANSTAAPSSIKRSPANRNCNSKASLEDSSTMYMLSKLEQVPVSNHNQISFPGAQKAFSQHAQHHPERCI